ncbi:glycosyltransferase family 4 protein [Rickettsiales bacterium LUAb2]
MKIIQIYPFNNPVSQNNTKPVVMAGIAYVKYSKFYNDITVLSSYTEAPYNDRVKILEANNKKNYNTAVIEFLLKLENKPYIIEVHQDTKLAAKLGNLLKSTTKVSLIKHGPDIYNRIHEKFYILRKIYEKVFLSNLQYIFGVSNYVTNCFCKNYPKLNKKFITLYNSYGHLDISKINNRIEKQQVIMFAGKPIQIKGIFEFMASLPIILNKFNNWTGLVIGAFFSKKSKYKNPLAHLTEDSKIKALIESNKLIFYSNLKVDQVFSNMQKAKILVIPSIFQEVFGLTALEAHIAGCIVISSGTGGLKEVSGDFAYYLDKVTSNNITNKLEYIINNLEIAEKLAKEGQAYALNKFNPQTLVDKLDNIRESTINERRH